MLQEERAHQFFEQLKAALENEAKQANEAASNAPRLREQRAELLKSAANLIEAIAISSLLSGELSALESKLADVDRQLAPRPAPKPHTFSVDQIREFLRQGSQQFFEVLTSDPERGKLEIQKRITKLDTKAALPFS